MVALFAPPRAAAQRTSSLSWVRLQGAEHCIGTQELAGRVEARVGRRVFVSASQADLSIEGHVAREGDALVARLVVSDRAGVALGERVLRVRGTDCAALEASLVLVIAIGLDPDATLPADASERARLSDETRLMLAQLELPKLSEGDVLELAVPSPEGSDKAPPAAPSVQTPGEVRGPQTTPVEDAPAATRPSVAVAVHLGTLVELGVLPDPSVGASLRVTLQISPLWPIQVSLIGLLPQTVRPAATRGAGEFDFWATGLALCPEWIAAQPVGVLTCAGARIGMLRSEGTGFAQSSTAVSTWVDVTLQVGPALRFGSVGLDLTGRLSVPVVRDSYQYEDLAGRERSLHRAGSVVGGVELAAGYFF